MKKKSFFMLILIVLGTLAFADNVQLAITDLDCGFEISNLDSKKQKIAKGRLAFGDIDKSIRKDQVIVILKKKTDKFDLESLAQFLAVNDLSSFVLKMNKSNFVQEDLGKILMSNYDSVLIFPRKGTMSNLTAECQEGILCITNFNLEPLSDNILYRKEIDYKCDKINEKVYTMLNTIAGFTESQIKQLESKYSYIRNNFVCQLSNNGTFGIVGYTGDSVDNLVIPDSIEGIPVTIIGSLQSTNHSKFKTLTIPKTIIQINQNACINLGIENLIFEDGSKIEEIQQNAFRYNKIGELTIPRNKITFGFDAFSDNRIKKVSMYKEWFGVYKQMDFLKQSENGFIKSDYLEEVIYEEGCMLINVRDFAECHNLKKVSLPSTIKKIGAYAFLNCTSLTDVSFEGVPLVEVTNLNELYDRISTENDRGLPNDPKVTIQSLQDTFAIGVYDTLMNPFSGYGMFRNCPIQLKSKSILLQLGIPANAF